jgi:penicillin G amidase
MNRRAKIFIGIIFTVIVFAAAFYIISTELLKRPLPKYEGEIVVKGITRDVKIFRDDYAVPYIYAENDEDAAFALGFVHAQERLFQMDILRRAGEGRLSEVLGGKTVPIDKMFRTIGLYKNVETNFPKLSDDTKRILAAYSKGINQFINQARGKYPLEFALLGYEPYQWKPEHSLVLAKMMAWELNISWWTDIAYTHLVQKLGEEKAKEIIPDYPQNAPVIIPPGIRNYAQVTDELIKIDRQFRQITGFVGTHIGSNAWVVNGSMSATGKPILANDPHLSFQAPGKWMVVVIRSSQGWNVEGFTIPGLPAVVIGKNKNIAWGMTNVMADDADFYIEKLDDPKLKYFIDGNWQDLKIENDSIEVKDSSKVYYQIKKTHRGPVITDIHSNNFLLNTSSIQKAVLSMRWTALEFSDEFKGIFSLNKAAGWEDFKAALKDFTVPGQNFVYADNRGNIGYVCAARLPIRNNVSPTFVYDGSTSANDWRGFVPYEEMPKIFNPPENYIATANNKTVKDFRYHISNLWEPSSRIERIIQLLKSKEKHSSGDFKKYQTDFYSPYAKEISGYIEPAFKGINIKDENMRNALSLISKWDHTMNSQSQIPSIYAFFYQNLLKNIFMDEMGIQLYDEFVFMSNIPYKVVQKLLLENKSTWFDDINTSQIEDRDIIIRRSLADALNELEKSFGKDMQAWQWGEIHKLTFKHLFHGQSGLFDKFGDIGEFSIGGDGTTVFNTEFSFNKPFETRLGPSMRFIHDFSTPDEFDFILPTGQSGHIMSPHYKDMTKLWLNGNSIKINLRDENIYTKKMLILRRD